MLLETRKSTDCVVYFRKRAIGKKGSCSLTHYLASSYCFCLHYKTNLSLTEAFHSTAIRRNVQQNDKQKNQQRPVNQLLQIKYKENKTKNVLLVGHSKLLKSCQQTVKQKQWNMVLNARICTLAMVTKKQDDFKIAKKYKKKTTNSKKTEKEHCTELIGRGGFIIMFILRANLIITYYNKKKNKKWWRKCR